MTGHRDLLDPDAVTAKVHERLVELQHRFRADGATHVTFLIYSALAEGADRLVVQEASRVLGHGKVELHVVLPLGPDEYRKDFSSSKSVQEFAALLKEAIATEQMPPVDDREEAYPRAGKHLVDRSDLLFAVWDGRSARDRGGTAEIVKYAHDHRVGVLVIPTARPGGAARAWKQLEVRIPRRPAVVAYDRIAEFNRAGPDDDKIAKEKRRYREVLRGSPIVEQYDAVATWALPRFVRADVLAKRYERWHHTLGAGQFILLALAITTVASQLEAGLSDRFALLEVGLMLAALATLLISRRLHTLDRWFGFRSLAEAFRGGLFIAMTSAEMRNETQSTGELPAADERWDQRAFTTAWEQRPLVSPDPSRAQDLQHFVIEGWLKDQINDHENAGEKLRLRRKLLTAIVQLLLAGTVIAALVHAFEPLGESTPRELLFFLAIALPGFGAAFTGIREQHQLRMHEQRSLRTAQRLRRLEHAIETPANIANVQRLALEIQEILRSGITEWSGMVQFEELEPAV